MVIVFAVALAAAAPQPSATAEPHPVGLDAVVVDEDGRTLEDLGPRDFQILEDGMTRPVTAVQVGRGETGRVFALFLDEYHVAPGPATARARDLASRLVAQLDPLDGLVVLKPLQSLTAIAPVAHLDQALAAIDTFDGRLGDYTPRTAFERSYFAEDRGQVEAARAQIATSALSALATYLGRLPGSRKTLLVVSAGFPDLARRHREALPTLTSVARVANRSNVAVYLFDPTGPPEYDVSTVRDARSAALSGVVRETGGFVLGADDDFNAEVSRIVSEARSHYVVTFDTEPSADEEFRPVEIHVARAGARVRARRGYYLVLPGESRAVARHSGTEVRRAPDLPRRTSRLIRPWFGLSRGDDGLTRVKVAWEPTQDVPGAAIRGPRPAQVTLRAWTLSGDEVFSGSVRSWAPRAEGADPRVAVFDVAPGRLRVEMAIEDAAATRIDTDVRDVSVRTLSGPLTLGTAEVLRARTARDVRALDLDAEAVPVPAREFSRVERLLVRVPVYAEQGSPHVHARLLSRLGGAMRDVPVDRRPWSDVFQLEVPLAGLAPGEYALEITARSGTQTASESVTFRVTP